MKLPPQESLKSASSFKSMNQSFSSMDERDESDDDIKMKLQNIKGPKTSLPVKRGISYDLQTTSGSTNQGHF